MLKTAIRDNDPVMFFEHKMLYTTKFNDVPEVEEDVCIPFGRARIVTEGRYHRGHQLHDDHQGGEGGPAATEGGHQRRADRPAHHRAPGHRDNHQVGEKTGKLLIVDEGHLSFGITGEIASRIMPDVFYDLDAPIQRMGTADVPLPFSPALEFPLIPDEEDRGQDPRDGVRRHRNG